MCVLYRQGTGTVQAYGISNEFIQIKHKTKNVKMSILYYSQTVQ